MTAPSLDGRTFLDVTGLYVYGKTVLVVGYAQSWDSAVHDLVALTFGANDLEEALLEKYQASAGSLFLQSAMRFGAWTLIGTWYRRQSLLQDRGGLRHLHPPAGGRPAAAGLRLAADADDPGRAVAGGG